MKKLAGTVVVTAALLTLLGSPARAVITFTQLDQTTFTVSHRVKVIGSRGKATKMVYTKASSLCVAAGYAYYQVLDQASSAAQQYEAANATLTVRFFQEAGENRIACQEGADPEYVQEAREKLQHMGYQPPEAEEAPAGSEAADAEAPEGASGTCPQSYTIEQIAAMARSGLSDERIRAACGRGHELLSNVVDRAGSQAA